LVRADGLITEQGLTNPKRMDLERKRNSIEKEKLIMQNV